MTDPNQTNTPNPIPMIAPDGTSGLVQDPQRAQELIDKNYKPGVLLRAPDGTQGVVQPKDLARLRAKNYLTEGEYQQKHTTASKPSFVPAQVPAYTGLWDRLTSPLHIQSLQDTIKKDEDYSNSAPTQDEVANHPISTPIKKAVSGALGDATKMLSSPAGMVSTLAAPYVAEVPAARALLTTMGLGFGASGAADLVQHGVTPNASLGEQDMSKYTSRLLGDAAALTGGAAGVAEVPHAVEAFKARPNPSAPTVETSTGHFQNAADPKTAAAQARIKQAVGGGPVDTNQTIHVDPALAGEIDAWSKSDLPQKRVILKTQKNGQTKIQLAHTNPDVPGFQYTDTKTPAFTSEPSDSTVPVELSKTEGNRGTAKPGHFLAAKVGDIPQAQPIAEAPAAPEATSTPAPVVPQPESLATPLEASSVAPAEPASPATPVEPTDVPPPDKPVGGVSPGIETPAPPTPLPKDIASSAPRYGYKDKNFQLDFEDPHDKAAYTLGQTKDNKAQAKFLDYLRQEYPNATDADLKAHSLKVRDAVKQLAKNGDPTQGPLKVPSLGGIKTTPVAPPVETPKAVPAVKAPVETPPVETPKPAVDVSPLEDKIRPVVGKLLYLKRLRTGEAAFYAIDKAIDATKSVTGEKIDPDTQQKLSALLGEPVGDKLTPDQITKLEARRGATVQGRPSIEILRKEEAAKRAASDPEGYLAARNKSMVDMVNAINDPGTPPELTSKIMDVLSNPRLSEGHDGAAPDVLFHRQKTTYPKPTDTPADHPEAPFIDKQLGHSITPINGKNYKAVFGGGYKDALRLDQSDITKYVKPEELAQLNALSGKTASEGSLSPSGIADRSETMQDAVRSLVGLDSDGEEGGPGSTRQAVKNGYSPEYQDYYRQLKQRVLDRKIGQLEGFLRNDKTVQDWRANKPGQTPLLDQLNALPEDTKKLLPKELFDAQARSTASGSSSPSALNEESVQTSTAPKKVPTTIRPGSKTPTEGIKFTKWDAALQQANPEAVKWITKIHDAVAETLPSGTRQTVYAKASQVFHDAVLAKDPYALKKAIDVVQAKGEAGFLDLSSRSYKPVIDETQRVWNVATADALLSRWEAMPDSTLQKGKDGLWKGTLQRRIDQAAPIADDLPTRMQQADEHNELIDRLNDLKQRAGQAPSIYHSLGDWARKMVSTSPAEGVIRNLKGTLARDVAILNEQFHSVDALADTMPVAVADQIVEHIQSGEHIPFDFKDVVDPKMLATHEAKYGPVGDINDLVARLRAGTDQARDLYTKHSGNLQEYIVNYMAGEYTNVGKARATFSDTTGRSEMYGGSDFLKQKVHDTQMAAMAAGLDPVTNNFVRRSLLTIQGLRQAAMPFELRNQFVDNGYAKEFDPKTAPPDGWQALDARVFGSGDTQYFAPPEIAKTFNNFVSKGLGGAWKVPFTKFSIYDALRHSNNLQNMAQLSFSLFHLSDITANSFLTALETGARKVANEGVFGGTRGMSATDRLAAAATGMGQMLKSPLAPIEMYMKGRNIEVNYRNPLKQQGYDQTVSDLERTNSHVRTPDKMQLQQWKMFQDQFKRVTDSDFSGPARSVAAAKSIVHLMGTVPEAFNYPLMNHIIPLAKLGALDTMFEQIHREYANAHPDVLDDQLQKASDSVDNRFGEMNMDNIFWHRTVKDLATLLTRSVGWTYGTIREVGGGIKDLGTTGKQLATGAPVSISPRTAYLGAMVGTTMLFNAVRQFVTTGQPAHRVDYFYPKNGTQNGYGEDNRDYPKFFYTYDPINYAHDPLGTIGHKFAPGFSTMLEIKNNEDYYHHQIWQPGGKPLANFKSLFSYMARGFEPFSVSNTQEGAMRGSKNGVSSMFGIMPAPQWVGRTPAENLAFRYFQGTKASDPGGAAQMEMQKNFIELRNKVNEGTITDDQIQDAVDKGKLLPKMVKYLYETKIDPDTKKPITPPIVTWLKSPIKDPDEIWNVWRAASPEEKKVILPVVMQKMQTLTGGEVQEQYMNQLQAFADKNP